MLTGLPAYLVRRLQSVLNAAAQLTSRAGATSQASMSLTPPETPGEAPKPIKASSHINLNECYMYVVIIIVLIYRQHTCHMMNMILPIQC